jgi:hypothetical protein
MAHDTTGGRMRAPQRMGTTGGEWTSRSAWSSDVGTPTDESEREYCEVTYGRMGSWQEFSTRLRFEAAVVGPQGAYLAAVSPWFWEGDGGLPYPGERHGEWLRYLVRTLVADGWEPLSSHGAAWYSCRFQRRAGHMWAMTPTADEDAASVAVAPEAATFNVETGRL